MKRRRSIRQSLTPGASLGASLVSSPALTADGGWPVGGTWVDSAAGHSSARLRVRVRVRTIRPMDTGLVGSIPAFFVSKLTVRDGANLALLRIQTFEPVSENPVFSFEFAKAPTGPLRIVGVDKNGHRIDSRVE